VSTSFSGSKLGMSMQAPAGRVRCRARFSYFAARETAREKSQVGSLESSQRAIYLRIRLQQ